MTVICCTALLSGALIASLAESEPHHLSFVAEEDSAFSLTGRTGSLMYMAPEVFKELPYCEKVCMPLKVGARVSAVSTSCQDMAWHPMPRLS